jgi:predicted O-methyltransferase YrrM
VTEERWSAVDAYFFEALHEPDPVLDATLADARAQGLPTINVAPNQAKLLYLLARSIGARRVLEEKRRSPCATAGCGGGG